ncbi:hypothetical protein NN561_005239 [Cricetulus griseus]
MRRRHRDPGVPELLGSECSRAGGRKDRREQQSRENKDRDRRHGTRDRRPRGAQTGTTLKLLSVHGRALLWKMPKAGNEFVLFSARSGSDLHRPPTEISRQSRLRSHAHIYR